MPESSIENLRTTVLLGLDCGGSSCRSLAVDESGTPIYRGHAGAANLASTPEPLLVAHLRRALADCPPPTQICGCFAGLLTQGDRERAKRIIGLIFKDSCVRAEPDYYAALAASPSGTDICIIAGTGSLVCSRPKGKVVKSGGRGFALGDYGSAFRYGRAFLLSRLETNCLPDIREELIEVFGTYEEADILSTLYRKGPIATRLARMAQFFARDVQCGKPYALDFLREESLRLARIVVEHIERHFPELVEINLCMAGGLWRISPIFDEEIAGRLNELSGGRKINRTRIRRAPVEGAVTLARELLNEHGIS